MDIKQFEEWDLESASKLLEYINCWNTSGDNDSTKY